MRVIHIIPAAFDYFDDIKKFAFSLIEEMNAFDGVETEAFTLQYNNATTEERIKVRHFAPHQKYVGTRPVDEVAGYLNTFDVIHLHAPFLGAGKILLKWRQANPGKIFTISEYRKVAIVDLISVGIRWYNNYYLKRLKLLADIVLEGENAREMSAEEILAAYEKAI